MMKLQVKLMGHARIPTLSAEDEGALRKSGANRVAGSVRQHLLELKAATGSRKWWGKAARSVQVAPEEEDGRAVVAINHRGVHLHWKGGDVRPTGRPSEVTGKPTKSLLIPFPDSPLRQRGISLAELGVPKESIHVIKSKKGCPILVAGIEKKTRTNLIWLGKLVACAHFEPRPEVLPSEEALHAEAVEGARQALRAILGK
ncbi:MAG: hypothetical protein IJ943_09605 [Akkermansia sp.]|nr:hypothetical protein [Akkermansia sp.]